MAAIPKAKTEAITEPPPEWLLELAKQTFRKVDQAHQQVVTRALCRTAGQFGRAHRENATV